jgi:hypothetical protein
MKSQRTKALDIEVISEREKSLLLEEWGKEEKGN